MHRVFLTLIVPLKVQYSALCSLSTWIEVKVLQEPQRLAQSQQQKCREPWWTQKREAVQKQRGFLDFL